MLLPLLACLFCLSVFLSLILSVSISVNLQLNLLSSLFSHYLLLFSPFLSSLLFLSISFHFVFFLTSLLSSLLLPLLLSLGARWEGLWKWMKWRRKHESREITLTYYKHLSPLKSLRQKPRVCVCQVKPVILLPFRLPDPFFRLAGLPSFLAPFSPP